MTKRIATICSRKGSRTGPGAGDRLLAGKPLLAYSIEQARQSGMFDAIAVSSDDPALLQIAQEYGADHLIRRPDELARDLSPKVPAIRHCVKTVEERLGHEFDIIADLAVTAPLRLSDDIQGALLRLENSDAPNVTMGTPARHSPYSGIVEMVDGQYARISKTLSAPVYSRQEAPACYMQSGGFYAWRRAALFQKGDFPILDRTLLYEIPEDRSLDIATEFDFLLIRLLIENRFAYQDTDGKR